MKQCITSMILAASSASVSTENCVAKRASMLSICIIIHDLVCKYRVADHLYKHPTIERVLC